MLSRLNTSVERARLSGQRLPPEPPWLRRSIYDAKTINAFVPETMSSYNPIAKIKEAQEACSIQSFTGAPPGSKNAIVITHYDTTCIRKKLSIK